MKFKHIIVLFTLYIFPFTLFAQVGINTDNSSPDGSSMLDVKSTNKGVLIPRMDSTSRNAIIDPAIGLLVYDSTTASFWYHDEIWNEIRNNNQKISALDIVGDIYSDNLDCVKQISSIDNTISPRSMVLYGDYLIFSSPGKDSINIYDVSDPLNAVNHTHLGAIKPWQIEIYNDILYYSTDNNSGKITAVDISDPLNMSELSSINTGDEIDNFTVNGNLICGVQESSNLVIIDISNPNAMSVLFNNFIGLFGYGGFKMEGNHLFCFGFVTSEFHSIDISDPQNPVLDATIPYPNPIFLNSISKNETIINNHYYTVDINSQLRVFNITDPSNPILLPFGGVQAFKIFFFDSKLYAVNFGELSIYEMNGVNDFQLLANTDPLNSAFEVVATDKAVFIADWNANEILVVDNDCQSLFGLNPKDGSIVQVNFPTLTLNNTILGITEGNTVDLSGINSDNQNLSFNHPNLTISNGNSVNITGIDTDNQVIDKLNLNGTILELSLEDDGEVDQTLDLGSINTDTDNQTIDKLNLNGTILEMSLEDDGELDQTLDLSSIDTDTDNQTIDKLNLNGTILEMSLEDDGELDQTLDLSSIDTDTDNQTVDKLNLNGTILELSLEDDGEVDQTVDLVSIDTDTDNQTIDKLNLNGTILELSLEDDGEGDKTINLASIDTDTDNQTLTFISNTNTLSITDGNSVNLSSIDTDTDEQDLSLSGNIVNIEGGSGVDLTNILVPVGTIQMWPNSSPPTGWLICNGGTFNASTYPDLNSVLGGNILPDFNGRFPLGSGNSGSTGSYNHPLEEEGGAERTALLLDQIPAHSHQVTIGYRVGEENGGGNNYSDLTSSGSSSTYTTTEEGGNGSNGNANPHPNMPPFYVINFIIKAK